MRLACSTAGGQAGGQSKQQVLNERKPRKEVVFKARRFAKAKP